MIWNKDIEKKVVMMVSALSYTKLVLRDATQTETKQSIMSLKVSTGGRQTTWPIGTLIGVIVTNPRSFCP